MSALFFGTILALGSLSALTTNASPQFVPNPNPSIADLLRSSHFEKVDNTKYAVVVNREATYDGAEISCDLLLHGATLFTSENEHHTNWLGNRINKEKDHGTGASKFWVGLVSYGVNGPLEWITKQRYQPFSNVIQVSGHDDETKIYAMAVPDGAPNRLKYEFLTHDDIAEAHVCQYFYY